MVTLKTIGVKAIRKDIEVPTTIPKIISTIFLDRYLPEFARDYNEEKE
jgi:hypothetical protein